MDVLFLWSNPPEWWRFLGLMLTWIAAFCLPYGERTPYPVKALVGCTYAAPLLFIGFNPWMVVVPVVFITLFILSNTKGFFASAFVWKIVEFSTGVIIGIASAFFVKHNELLMIVVMAVSGSLFAFGGTGYKWARRYVMPAALTALLSFGLVLR